MKLLIKFPTKNRKDKFLNVLYQYINLSVDKNNLKFLITIDNDDVTMNNSETLSILDTIPNLIYTVNESKSKIDAVNRDMDIIDDWDIVLLASDDMIPQIIGYDEIIRKNMETYYPDTDGVLFFNDGFQGDRLNTLSIMGRKYYNRFNYIYHPDYKSQYSDNEFMEVANILGKQTYFENVIIKHEHPDWGYGQNDNTHLENMRNLNHDYLIYINRKNNNYFL